MDIHLNDVTDAFYQLSFVELPTKEKLIIVDGAITNFYYGLFSIPFNIQVPVELVKILDKFRDLFDYFRDFWLHKYEIEHIVYRTMARYFASLFLYVFYTYDVSILDGNRLSNKDIHNQRGLTIGAKYLTSYATGN